MANPVEHVKAKVAGITGAVEARFKGLKGVFMKLAEQHHAVSSLLSDAEKTDDFTRRAALWAEIRRELVSHEQAELLQVYPVLEDYETTREIAHQHTEAAAELEAAVQELDSIGFQSDAWQPALERLIARVQAHVELEEEQLFPRAQEALGDEAARELEGPFERARELALARLG
jgi:iron-sulfur cluster repair protein YtfE (RIC family)